VANQSKIGLGCRGGKKEAMRDTDTVVVVHCTAPCSPAGDFSEIPLELFLFSSFSETRT
jgi:hypothetical protein